MQLDLIAVEPVFVLLEKPNRAGPFVHYKIVCGKLRNDRGDVLHETEAKM